MTIEKPTERKCEHAQDYGGDLAYGELYTCKLDGRCDRQKYIGQGKPFCKIALNQENWYDERGKPRFEIWQVE